MKVVIEKTRDKYAAIQPFLVDVPVKVMIWVRPELQRKQFEVIKKSRPSMLFFVSDGGRNEEERKQIEKSREVVSEIDWDCTVHRLYWEENQGMYGVSKQAMPYIWGKVDRLIFLEDDIIPSVSFFSYCAELLERYKDDLRVHVINGMNHLGIYDRPKADYFFAKVGSIWGFATWKRTYEICEGFSYKNDPYIIDEVCKNAKKDTVFCRLMRGYAENEYVDGHIAGSEFKLVLNVFAQNQLNIVPKKNMISCHGCESGSTHAVNTVKKLAKGDAQIFYMKTYELDGGMEHPEYVFPDETYERKMKRVIAWHHPIIRTYRRWVGIIKRIYYGDGKQVLNNARKKIKRYIHKEQYIEK